MYSRIKEVLASDPGATALADFRTGTELSADRLLARVDELAAALTPLLPKEKTVVAMQLANGSDAVAVVLALWKMNHAVMPLPHSLTEAETGEILSAGPAFAILRAMNKSADGALSIAGLSLVRRQPERVASFAMGNLAFVRFTSGTTENARGVLISHEAIFNRARSFGRALGLRKGQSVLWHLDMSYHFTTSITAFLLHGCEIQLGQILLPSRFIEWLTLRKVDFFFSLPFFYDQWCGSSAAWPASSTRFYVTGQTVSAKTLAWLRERFGVCLRRMYGVIEAGIPALDAQGPDPRVVGKVAEPFEVRLEDGEILVRGPGAFDGYLMGDAFEYVPRPSEWFKTGDLGRWTNDNELVITGRLKDMIVAPGCKFFPSEVEGVLENLSGVQACAVYMTNGELVASYEGSAKPELVAEFARRHLERAKVPSRFVKVKQLLRTPSGKIMRREVL